jgi:chromosome segregation ATPase
MLRLRVRLVLVTGFALLGTTLTLGQPGSGQTGETDAQTLRAILAELRALHNDVRLTAVSQILLTELESQQTVVNAATERLNSARLQLSNMQLDEKRQAADLSHVEDQARATTDSQQKTAMGEEADRLRAGLAGLKVREEAASSGLDEAERQLGSAQDTLDGIQRDLDATVKRLRPVAGTL